MYIVPFGWKAGPPVNLTSLNARADLAGAKSVENKRALNVCVLEPTLLSDMRTSKGDRNNPIRKVRTEKTTRKVCAAFLGG